MLNIAVLSQFLLQDSDTEVWSLADLKHMQVSQRIDLTEVEYKNHSRSIPFTLIFD